MAVELLPKLLPKTITRTGAKSILSLFGLLAFRATSVLPTGASFSRSTVASFTANVADFIVGYLPGYTIPGSTFSRSTAATYTAGP